MKFIYLIIGLIFPICSFGVNGTPSLSTPAPTESLKDVGLSYFGYYSSEAGDVSSGDASLYYYNSVTLSYKLNPRFTFNLAPSLVIESSGTRYADKNQPSKTYMADSHISIVHKNPFDLPFSIRSKSIYKYIFPTAPEWQQAGSSGALGANFEFTYNLFPGFAIGYYPKGYIVLQSDDTYVSRTNDFLKISPTEHALLEQWIRLTKHFGDKMFISQGLGLKDSFFNASTKDQKSHDQFYLFETTFNISINDNMEVGMGIGQQTSRQRSTLSFYRTEESSYFLTTSIWM